MLLAVLSTTSCEGATEPAAVPLEERTIAFRNENDIWTMRVDGSGLHNVTADPEWSSEPAWSPDGRFIYFNDRMGIARSRADGSGRERVTRGMHDSPSLSPDGRRMAFTEGMGGDWYLRVRASDGTVSRLAQDEGLQWWPAWSPDGRAIVFAQYPLGLRLVRMDGGSVQRLTTGADVAPDWSPDGSRIVFGSETGARVTELWIVNADGSAPRRVTTGRRDESPSWSRDGEWIVFSRAYSSDADGPGGLFIIRPDGTGLRRLPLDAAASAPSWKPER